LPKAAKPKGKKPRKVPLRMCVGCREMKPKASLLRVVRAQDGAVSWDPKGKAPGRGAYVCRDAACFKRAVKQKQLERALDHAIDPAVFEALLAQLPGLPPAPKEPAEADAGNEVAQDG